MHIKMFRNFPKKSGGRYWFQDLGQKRLFIYNQHLPILLDLCVVLCGSVKCSFSVYSVIFFSCQTVNNCIGNMLDFPEFLHLARNFLNQSNCRTFQTSILKKQAILNMQLDIMGGLDILGINVFAWSWSTQKCPQLGLDQSNSKILETPITQEKF